MGIWNHVLRLFLRDNCPLCQRSSPTLLCRSCQAQILRCQSPKQDWQTAWRSSSYLAWGTYQDSLRRTLTTWKYENQPQLAQPLGLWLAQAWQETHHDRPQPPKNLVVVPIPMHPDKLAQRGFNQAALLARHFCRHTGLRLREQGLQRIKATTAQFQLSASERARNLTGAFSLGPDLQHRHDRPSILLVDDILTTGSTVQSARSLLAEKGFPYYGLVVMAKTAPQARVKG